MRVIFCGVGEAFDEHLPNTSLLLESEEGSLLLDCGFTAPPEFRRFAARPQDLDAVCISHYHGDHWFGLPALLVRFAEEGREKNLTIIGPEGVEDKVGALMELAYPGTLERAAFTLRFLTSAPDRILEHAGFRMRFARSDHPAPCLAVRVEADGKSVFYSGDGRPTEATQALARGCDLVVHEAFSLEPETPGHGTVDGCIAFARNAGVGSLALVHVRRTLRDVVAEYLRNAENTPPGLTLLLPEPGDVTLL